MIQEQAAYVIMCESQEGRTEEDRRYVSVWAASKCVLGDRTLSSGAGVAG